MNILLYITTVCVWGSTWLAITYQLGSIPIELSIFYRFGFASLLVFIGCFWRSQKMKFPLKIHFFLMIQGFFLFSMNYIASYEASAYISSGLNAIGFSMILIFNILNSYIFYRIPLTLPVVVGALCGFCGITAIFWPSVSTLNFSNDGLLGVFLSLLGAILASFGNMISVRNQKENIPVTESNAYAMGYGALWMLGVICFKGIPFQFDTSAIYILSLLHLSIFGSVIAFGCYLTLLGRIGANKAAYALIVVPMVALVFSTFFEDFVWEPHIFLGLGLIIFGNVVILARKPEKVAIEEEKTYNLPLKKAA